MNTVWDLDEEARRLKQRFTDAKAQGISQAQFARDYALRGGASMVNQHISGNRPMNLEAAGAYAKGFKCSLAEISPRLAASVRPHVQQQIQAPSIAYKEPSPMARQLAMVFDMIPEGDYSKRSKAYLLAEDAIAAVLQDEAVTLVVEPGPKK